jgi:hypothetical protein
VVEKNPPQRKAPEQVDAKVAIDRIQNRFCIAMPLGNAIGRLPTSYHGRI